MARLLHQRPCDLFLLPCSSSFTLLTFTWFSFFNLSTFLRFSKSLCNSASPSTMEQKTQFKSEEIDTSNDSKTQEFPIPLSPLPPPISKEIEFNRAMAAKSNTVALTRSEFVYEDEWLIVVNKPCGIYSEQVLSSIPSLLNASPDSTMMELHLANRLDRDTSGLVVITKLHKVAGKLVKAFTEHRVKKTYIAICVGPTPTWKQISIQSGHGRSRFGLWRVYSALDIGRALPGGTVVKEMVTSFEVLAVNGHGILTPPANLKSVSETICFGSKLEMLVVEGRGLERTRTDNAMNSEILIRAYPQSGRTHQIRLHCQYFGIPIRGDVKYGGIHEWQGTTYGGHALHAESLSFDHPITGTCLEFHAPLPLWARQARQPIGSHS